MSFLELWDSFDAVKEHWKENRSMLESYLELIKLRAELEKSATKRLEKISQCHFFRMGKNTLVPVIEKLCSVFTSKLKASRLCSNMISNEIMQPLKDLMFSQESKIKEKSEQCKRLENDRKKVIKNLETLKDKYWKHCKESLLNNKFKSELTSKESSSLDLYIRQIDAVNKFNVNYVEEMGRHLAVFQISEEERLKHLRESLKKLHEAESLNINGILSEMDEMPLAINVFNPITELSKFIDDTRKDEPLKIITFEVSPYGNTCHIPELKNTPEDLILLKLNIKCWEGISLIEDDYKVFENLVSNPELRKSWLYFLNERRIKSQFLMPNTGFTTMSKLLNLLLNKIESDFDENAAKLTLILAQTFYCEKSGEKIFLHASMVGHSVWQKESMWLKIIENGILKEMSNYAQFCSDETSEIHKERMEAILVSQLSSYVHIMKTFEVSLEFITRIAESLVDKYKIELDITEFIG